MSSELRKAGLNIGIAALNCKPNGTITSFSVKAVNAIYAAKPDVIVAIVDEIHISHFFTFVSTPRFRSLSFFTFEMLINMMVKY